MRRLLLSLTVLTVLSMIAFISAFRTQASGVSIEVGNLYFCSVSQQGVCETTVSAGDTVTWNNVAGFHTVTECDEAFASCPPAGGFDSGTIATGNSFSHTFATAGVFAYHCSFHPTAMRGRITVQAAPTPTPTPAPTAAPSGSTTPAPSATAAPAAVPKTGGTADGGGLSAGALALVVLGSGLLATAVTGVRAAVRARG